MNRRLALALASVLLVAAGCRTTGHTPPPAAVPPPPRVVTHPPSAPAPVPRATEPWVDVSITTAERQVIQGYVAGHAIEQKYPKKGKKPKSLPPGLQKKLERGGTLPPGWESKMRKGEILPVEVYRECHPLPQEVLVKLPPPPPGTILITVGGKIARILAATREILDVFEVGY